MLNVYNDYWKIECKTQKEEKMVVFKFLSNLMMVLPDRLHIRLMYMWHIKKWLHLKKPQTYTEKLQWLKLYDRNPEYVKMVDKVLAKQYVAEKIGSEYIVPTLKIWTNANEIAIEDLPAKFVIKCNHDSKSVLICTDKEKIDIEKIKNFFGKRLKKNGYWYGREWPYKSVQACVFAEQYIETKGEDLKDYKILCFNGQAKFVEVHSNRFTDEHTQDIYDMTWTKTDIYQGPHSNVLIEKPKCFEKMVELTEILAKDIPHVRVDWYSVEDNLLFGELTFFDGSGYERFENPEHDLMLGQLIKLDS